MKKKILVLFIWLFCQCSYLLAQGYTGLQSMGTMPQGIQYLLKGHNLTDDETDLRSIFMSGKVIYGTPINAYLDSIANYLFSVNPKQEHKQIHVYLYKSPEVNAFMCKDGSMFVNIGLIAQASSEAEIALVLSHEFSHFDKGHYTKPNKKKLKDVTDAVDYVLKKSLQSRENEMEADSYGLQHFFKQTNYSYEAVAGMFDLLQYGYLPFDEIPFKRSFVETKNYHFPDDYYLTNIKPIKSREDYVDTFDTHPNLKKRRENAAEIISGLSDKGRTEFHLRESEFDKIRDMARKEAIYINLTNHDYGEAFYNSYVLLSENPDDKDVNEFAAIAMYGLEKYKKESEMKDVLPDYKEAEGESGAAYYFLKQLNRKEMSVLALRFIMKAHLMDPTNDYMMALLKDVLSDVRSYGLESSSFCDFAMGTTLEEATRKVKAREAQIQSAKKEVAASSESAKKKMVADKTDVKSGKHAKRRGRAYAEPATPAVSEVADTSNVTETKSSDVNRRSKYDKIKDQQKRGEMILPDSNFTTINYMLVDYKRDTAFYRLMEAAQKKEEAKAVDDLLNQASTTKVPFDGGNVLLITYYFSNTMKKAIRNDKRIQNVVIEAGKRQGINFISFERQVVDNPNTENYNVYSQVMGLQTETILAANEDMIQVQNKQLDSTLSKMGITKVLDLRMKQVTYSYFSYSMATICSVWVPIVFPVQLARCFIPRRLTSLSADFYDLKTRKTENKASLDSKGYNQKPRLEQFLYNYVNKIKKGK